ncbi:hypothetical protein R3P38DRAFT_3086884 [Favolaschia claudopus]|uniref:Uncharacterized protein n=1 Tax=Favolaschia claudopus TaxID=2862362 RepID=A0AAV9ZUB4_9AGAR
MTLSRRVQGGHSIRDANQKQQKVPIVTEWALVQFMRESADRGFPLILMRSTRGRGQEGRAGAKEGAASRD